MLLKFFILCRIWQPEIGKKLWKLFYRKKRFGTCQILILAYQDQRTWWTCQRLLFVCLCTNKQRKRKNSRILDEVCSTNPCVSWIQQEIAWGRFTWLHFLPSKIYQCVLCFKSSKLCSLDSVKCQNSLLTLEEAHPESFR